MPDTGDRSASGGGVVVSAGEDRVQRRVAVGSILVLSVVTVGAIGLGCGPLIAAVVAVLVVATFLGGYLVGRGEPDDTP